MISYSEACNDPQLFGPWFEGPSWATWRVLDKAVFGEPLPPDELATFKELTGCDVAPTAPVKELWVIAGRRSGKDVKAASLVTYFATLGAEMLNYQQYLTRGERGVVQLLAVDRDQAKVCFGYTLAFFEQPMLKAMVTRFTANTIELTNGLAIEITTNDRRRVRGRTVIAVVFDECAFWKSENTVNPDEEVYEAVKPAMITIPGSTLIVITSPHARRGLVWRKFQKHFGKPGSILVAKAPTWRMNLTIPETHPDIVEAYERDPSAAAAEWGAEFRSDLEQFVDREIVEACVSSGVHERPPISKNQYRAFVDPSGGSSDAMTLAIAHREGERLVLDALRERKPPFSPESVVGEYADTIKLYRVGSVTGDRYAGEWPREQFRKLGVTYLVADKVKSDLYRDLLPALNSASVDLVDNDTLINQIVSLERRVSRGGRDSIDHPPRCHDDLANVVAGAISLLSEKYETPVAQFGSYL